VEPDGELLHFLVQEGAVVAVGAGVVFSAAAYEQARGAVVRALEEGGTVTLADVRDLLGTTRKYAQALLEHLDAEKVTRRVGDARVLRGREVRS
jgi:selenocysteine-specific elongation factor